MKYFCQRDCPSSLLDDLPLEVIQLTVLWLSVGERKPAFPVKDIFTVCDDCNFIKCGFQQQKQAGECLVLTHEKLTKHTWYLKLQTKSSLQLSNPTVQCAHFDHSANHLWAQRWAVWCCHQSGTVVNRPHHQLLHLLMLQECEETWLPHASVQTTAASWEEWNLEVKKKKWGERGGRGTHSLKKSK